MYKYSVTDRSLFSLGQIIFPRTSEECKQTKISVQFIHSMLQYSGLAHFWKTFESFPQLARVRYLFVSFLRLTFILTTFQFSRRNQFNLCVVLTHKLRRINRRINRRNYLCVSYLYCRTE